MDERKQAIKLAAKGTEAGLAAEVNPETQKPSQAVLDAANKLNAKTAVSLDDAMYCALSQTLEGMEAELCKELNAALQGVAEFINETVEAALGALSTEWEAIREIMKTLEELGEEAENLKDEKPWLESHTRETAPRTREPHKPKQRPNTRSNC